jgi:Tfp pilus tip-associated adhesin PilY1
LTGANIQTPATPQGRSLGNSSFFYAWFDLATYEGHLEHYRLTAAGSIMDEAGVNAIDSVTKEFEAGRDPYFDAAIPLRSNTARNLYTTKSGARTDFSTANVTVDDLDLQDAEVSAYPNYPGSGVTNTTLLRDAIVNFLYGQDAFNSVAPTSLRATVLGDIFHSNPLFIGTPTTLLMHEDGYESFYDTHEKRLRVVYAGANDGIFHAFSSGAWYDPADPGAFNDGDGEELFGYVPGLLLPNVKLVPRTDDVTGARLAPSFIDGNIVAADAWLGDGSGSDVSKSADEWATVVVAAFREGGKGYLALDATDPAAAAARPVPEIPVGVHRLAHGQLVAAGDHARELRALRSPATTAGDPTGMALSWSGSPSSAGYTKVAVTRNTYEDDPAASPGPAWAGHLHGPPGQRQILDSIVFDGRTPRSTT